MNANPGRRPHDSVLRERARELRAGGLIYREIADALDLPISTIQQWCVDPDGSRAKKRRARYRGICSDCGASTNSGSLPAPTRCAPCSHQKKHDERYWTQERVTAALASWSRANGGDTPRATAWLGKTPPGMPSVQTIQREFGSWSTGMQAAGLKPRRQGEYGRPGEDPAYTEEIARLYRSGLSGLIIARRFGVSENCIYTHLKKAGVKRRSYSEALGLRHAREMVAA